MGLRLDFLSAKESVLGHCVSLHNYVLSDAAIALISIMSVCLSGTKENQRDCGFFDMDSMDQIAVRLHSDGRVSWWASMRRYSLQNGKGKGEQASERLKGESTSTCNCKKTYIIVVFVTD